MTPQQPKLEELLNELEEKCKPPRDAFHTSGLEHPCKLTCSGWQQGFERGFDTAVDALYVKKLIVALREAEDNLKYEIEHYKIRNYIRRILECEEL